MARSGEGPTISLLEGLKAIYAPMSPRRRRELFAVLLLMLAGGIAELATIGAVVPFLALLANASAASKQAWLRWLPSTGGTDPVLVAALAFILIAIATGLIRLQLVRSTRNFIFRLGHDVNFEIQRRVLLQPFSFHIQRNTSTLLSALDKTEGLLFFLLLPLMHAVASGVIALFIIALLLFVAPLTTVAVAAAFVATYALISAAGRKRLAANSAILEHAYDDRLQIVQESLGGIRDVIIDDSRSAYLQKFASIDSELAGARATTEFITIAPRYVIEMAGMTVLTIIAVLAAHREGGIAAALPVLGALALGAQRLLPLVQEVYVGWSSLQGQRSIFGQIIELLRLPVRSEVAESASPIEPPKAIRLEEVSFSYPTRTRPALDGVSLALPGGSMVALVGATGSGKSTLLDVLMGLLRPDEGRIMIDDVALDQHGERHWHRSIAHVPQSIFLADSTIARNIALSLPDMPPDSDRIVTSAKKAQLHEFVSSLSAQYETFVGERGVRLSGGQRQRLGLARAIYKGASVLVLDEATSALDDATETAVMGALEGLRREGRTIIIVAHRVSTIRYCGLVARLDHGRLVHFGPIDEFLAGYKSSSHDPRDASRTSLPSI
jgi:ABC-type multidrug transport system fused ATPase/permease subunit